MKGLECSGATVVMEIPELSRIARPGPVWSAWPTGSAGPHGGGPQLSTGRDELFPDQLLRGHMIRLRDVGN